jgi:geranylgeranyl pyrophosphate synthase
MATATPATFVSSAVGTKPLADSRFHGLRVEIETVIDQAICQGNPGEPRLAQAIRYAVFGGGKRFRSLLALAAGEVVDAPKERVLRVAAAIECIHAQTLVHDDLPCMDDDDLRRGRPSLHRKFDEATAVLAGDALIALAFEILADPATHPDGDVRARLVLALARTMGQDGLAGGQMMDLYPPASPSSRHTFECQARKTGALIRYAVEAATMLGSSTVDVTGHLMRFAGALGLVFQIRDDLLDAVGNPAIVGKSLRKDIQSGRQSATALLGVEGAIGQATELEEACRAALAPLGRKASALLELAHFAVTRMH